MIPKFLRPEVVVWASIEIVTARLTDSQPPPPPLAVICAWCPAFDPTTQAPGLSHGICPTCTARLEAELDAREAQEREDRERDECRGARCGTACGFCGGCS